MTKGYLLTITLLYLTGQWAAGQTPFHYRTNRATGIEQADYQATAAVKQTADGGFVAFTNTSMMSILKFDTAGKLTWSYDFSPGLGCNGIQLSNGGYAAIGSTGGQLLLVRTGAGGNLLWAKTYSAATSGNWIQQTLDGGFVMGGYTVQGYIDQSVLIKTDSSGNIKWARQWSMNDNHVENLSGVQLSDSTYVFGGGIGYTSPDGIILMKTDKNGNLLWNKVYQLSGISYTFSMRATRDKGFVMVGTDNSPIWHVLKTDSAGDVQWSKRIYPDYTQPYGYAMDVEQLDYGYAVAGWFYNKIGYSSSYLVKLDPTGNLLWNRTYTDTYWTGLYSVKQTADKGLVAYGSAQDTQGWGDFIKTDSNGLGGCAASETMVDTDFTFSVTTASLSLGSLAGVATGITNTYSGAAAVDTFFCTDTIHSVAPTAGFTVNDTSICAGSSVTFTDQSAGSPTGRRWYFSGGTPDTSTAPDPVITYQQAGTYPVKLVVSNSTGTDSLTKAGLVAVDPPPVAGAVIGPASVCTGTPVVLEDTGSTGSIQWQAAVQPGSFDNLPGDTTAIDSISSVSQTANYRVWVTNGCGADSSTALQLTVLALPVPVITASDSIFCPGDSVSLCTNGTYSSYLWNTNDSSRCTIAKEGGDFYVNVTDSNGCPAFSNHIPVDVYPAFSVSILRNGDTLSSFGAVTYQWIMDGSPVSGATHSFYVAATQGYYAVQVTDSNGCYTTSTAVFVTGIDDLTTGGEVSIYPNPTVGNWQLTVDNSLVGSALEVFDEQGRLVFNSKLKTQNSKLDLNIPAGVYYLRISNADGNLVKKLVKM